MQAVLPVPGRPEMYILPGFLLSTSGWRKSPMAASSFSLQKMVEGADVWRACLALVKLPTVGHAKNY